MKTDGCREWRESLGAYALGHLPDEERAGLEAHLEGCPSCRAELEQLTARGPADVARRPRPLRVGAAAAAPRSARRVAAAIAARAARPAAPAPPLRPRLRRRRGGGRDRARPPRPPRRGSAGPEQHVTFASLPKGMKISAKLIPNAFGTEIHMYVKGVSSGTLCRVYLRSRDGELLSAGTFRYRWGDGSYPILSSALDLSKTDAMEVRVGDRTYVAPVGATDSETTSDPQPGGTTMTKNLTALATDGGAGARRRGLRQQRRQLQRRRLRGRTAITASERRRTSRPGIRGDEADVDRLGGAAVVSVDTVPKLGKVIVDSKGLTLYDFHKDKGTTSSCYGRCAAVWPPMTTEGAPQAGRWACPPRSWARRSAKTAPPRSPSPGTRSTPTPRTRSRAKRTATTSRPSAASGTR